LTFRISVPGNLLLAGEYAVLEEGGLGAAIAVEPRLTVTAFLDEPWAVHGRWGAEGERWSPGAPPPFAGQAFLYVFDRLRPQRTARLEIDSSAFFDGGRKRGFGSSAALTVGLTAALAHLAEAAPEDFAQLAVEAHRHAQGGRGSGYDVMASWHGGYGAFIGGVTPLWRRLTSALPALAVFPGPRAVRTVGSIARYREWKAAHSDDADRFLRDNNEAVRALTEASGPSWFEAAERVRRLGLDLGNRIGRSAEIPRPAGLDDTFVKAAGAGNETGLAAASDGVWPSGVTPLRIAEGWRWE